MTAVLLDTHAWAWSLTDDHRLTEKAIAAIGNANAVYVSPISFFEIGQKVRIGKWPEMEPFVRLLPQLLEQQGGRTASMSPEVSLEAALMPWDHRDPFDRILAATALSLRLPLISTDAIFDQLGDLTRIW